MAHRHSDAEGPSSVALGTVPSPASICRLVYHLDTQQYGFVVSFPGPRPHWELHVFETMQRAMQYVDSHAERSWEEPREADDSCVLISGVQTRIGG